MTQIKRQSVEANGAQLYTEVRGSGPSVLFIQGGPGALAFSNTWPSCCPINSPRSSPTAAALLRALDLAPATISGTSSDGVIGLNLSVRNPDLVRGAMLQEPGLMSVLPDPQALIAQVMPIIEEAMARGGLAAAMPPSCGRSGEMLPANVCQRTCASGS